MEAKFELGLGRWAAARRGCEPSSDGAGPAENETEAGGWLGGSEAAGSFGAAGRDRLLGFSSQPRCSLRLLRVMKPSPNSRPRLGPHTSGSWNSSGFLGDREKDRKLGTSARMNQRVWLVSGELSMRRARRVLPGTRRQVLWCGKLQLQGCAVWVARQPQHAAVCRN